MADQLEESVDDPPRPRPQPRLPRRRLARAADADRGAAHVQRAADRPGGRGPAPAAEFLESSRVQLERLDWLAQNLLELSKLDSGLVLLDLRPDDLAPPSNRPWSRPSRPPRAALELR
jgi:signal transduction histidine kinase